MPQVINAYTICADEIKSGDVMIFVIKAMAGQVQLL